MKNSKRVYKSNYLRNVICRVDFLNEVSELRNSIPLNLSSKIKTLFPITEPKTIAFISESVEFKGGKKKKGEKTIQTAREWNFYTKNRDKHLCITNDTLFIDIKTYKSFANLKRFFINPVAYAFEVLKGLEIKRFGLRYINRIELNEKDPFNWSSYLNKDLLSIFAIPKNKSKISRAFHNLELNYGDYLIKFNYGMYNADYPAPIKRKIFILDFDAFSMRILNENEIRKFLPIFHKQIQSLFEESITDKMRRKLNGGE